MILYGKLWDSNMESRRYKIEDTGPYTEKPFDHNPDVLEKKGGIFVTCEDTGSFIGQFKTYEDVLQFLCSMRILLYHWES